jgi:hypothetical protein
MRESDVERYLVKRIKAIGGMCEKFSSPNKRGVPDRLVTIPWYSMFFVEVKAPGKEPTAQQERDHCARRALGVKVHVVDSVQQVDELIALLT